MTRLPLSRPRPSSFLDKLSNCVNRFEDIQFNASFDEDFEVFELRQLQLDIVRFRLHRWGEAFTRLQGSHIIDELGLKSVEAHEILDDLLQALDASQRTSGRRNIRMGPVEPLVLQTLLYKDLHERLMKMSSRTSTQHSNAGSKIWALYKDLDAKRLLVNVTPLLEDLEKLFPVDQILLELVQSAIDSLGKTSLLELLRDAAAATDEILCEAARRKLGHSSSRNRVDTIVRGGTARVHVGNTWTAEALKDARIARLDNSVNWAGHITANDESVVQVGNQYGGWPSIFRN